MISTFGDKETDKIWNGIFQKNFREKYKRSQEEN